MVLVIFALLSICILAILATALLAKTAGQANHEKNPDSLQTAESTTESVTGITESISAEETTPVSEPVTEAVISAIDENFYISSITDEIFERIEGVSFTGDCPVSRDELRYIHILHMGIDGAAHEGELIVNAYIAEDVLDIFHELYNSGYVIEKVALVDAFNANDNASMIVNNTSGFNSRKIEGTDYWSNHAYGLAIDINPLYNPYVADGDVVLPATAREYTDRSKAFDMKIDTTDLCYQLFIEHGFTWGGEWENVKDYMHFEKLIEDTLENETEITDTETSSAH